MLSSIGGNGAGRTWVVAGTNSLLTAGFLQLRCVYVNRWQKHWLIQVNRSKREMRED